MYPVLIVDDEPAIADLIEMTLETLGYRCVKAADGEAAADLLELEVIDKVIPEPAGGAHTDPETLYKTLDTVLARELNSLSKLSGAALAAGRYKKFRAMGAKALRKERT